jgi:hypothetical protein
VIEEREFDLKDLIDRGDIFVQTPTRGARNGHLRRASSAGIDRGWDAPAADSFNLVARVNYRYGKSQHRLRAFARQ